MWYRFRKLMPGKDAVDYKHYEYRPSDAELKEAHKKFEEANPGLSLLLAYPQIEEIDTPPKDFLNRMLADAELRRAAAEHEVNLYRAELHYHGFIEE